MSKIIQQIKKTLVENMTRSDDVDKGLFKSDVLRHEEDQIIRRCVMDIVMCIYFHEQTQELYDYTDTGYKGLYGFAQKILITAEDMKKAFKQSLYPVLDKWDSNRIQSMDKETKVKLVDAVLDSCTAYIVNSEIDERWMDILQQYSEDQVKECNTPYDADAPNYEKDNHDVED